MFRFPSGHAANTMALYLAAVMVLDTHRWRTAIVTLGAAAVGVVGFSRIAIGVHYPSDVLAGWLWVGAWAVLLWPSQDPHGAPGAA